MLRLQVEQPLKESEKKALKDLLGLDSVKYIIETGRLQLDLVNTSPADLQKMLRPAREEKPALKAPPSKPEKKAEESGDVTVTGAHEQNDSPVAKEHELQAEEKPTDAAAAEEEFEAPAQTVAAEALAETPIERHEFDDVLKDVVKQLFRKAAEEIHTRNKNEKSSIKRLAYKGLERALPALEERAEKALDKTEAYDGDASKVVGIINEAVPLLTKTFGESTVVKSIPPAAKHEEFVTSLERLGADPLAKIVRMSMK